MAQVLGVEIEALRSGEGEESEAAEVGAEAEVEVAAARLAADMLATPKLSAATLPSFSGVTPPSLSAALTVDLASTPIGMVNLEEAYQSAYQSEGAAAEGGAGGGAGEGAAAEYEVVRL